MADMPIESVNKYGKDQYDDIDSFADMLSGNTLTGRSRINTVDVGSGDEALDVDVLREAFNNARKYGG